MTTLGELEGSPASSSPSVVIRRSYWMSDPCWSHAHTHVRTELSIWLPWSTAVMYWRNERVFEHVLAFKTLTALIASCNSRHWWIYTCYYLFWMICVQPIADSSLSLCSLVLHDRSLWSKHVGHSAPTRGNVLFKQTCRPLCPYARKCTLFKKIFFTSIGWNCSGSRVCSLVLISTVRINLRLNLSFRQGNAFRSMIYKDTAYNTSVKPSLTKGWD